MPAVPARVDLVTPAEPDQGVPSTIRARLKAAALGVVGALLVPLPAAAAPAPCEQALRYAAQSGAQLMRIGSLDLGPAGSTDQPIRAVGVGDAKSALVAQSPINAAALGRVLDGGPANREALAEVLQQTAPPNQKKPRQQEHEPTEVGPFSLGRSTLTVRAQWDPRMGCGNTAGEATRSEAELRRAGVLVDGDDSLVHVPGKISGLSTTAMQRRGPAARAVAAASMAGRAVELLGGAIKIRIVRPPSLLATMSGQDGGEVRYQPAVLEVSGEGIETARLDTAGDEVEVRLDSDSSRGRNAGQAGANQPGDRRSHTNRDNSGHAGVGRADAGRADGGPGSGDSGRAGAGHSKGEPRAGQGGAGGGEPITVTGGTSGVTERASTDIARKPGAPTNNPDKTGGEPQDAGLPAVGKLDPAAPLPLPSIPGVPPLAEEPGTEAAPATGPGTTVKISLGDVRQAVSGHAIAAKATAIKVAITKGPNPQRYGHSPDTSSGVVLNFGMGLLEVAAVAPEPAGGVADAVGGSAGGLPITGPRVDVLALAGLALLIAGAGALVFGMRGRPRP
jgi:hypothetical protein